MKAIVRLIYGERNIIQYFDDVNCNCENILNFVEATNRQHGIITLVKNIEFLFSVDDVLSEYLKRQEVFYKLAKIASVTMKGNIDDVLFYDKIRIFLSLPQDKYIWTITSYSTHLYLVLDGKISDDIASYIRLDLKYGFEAFKIDIKYGSVLPLTMEELEKGSLCMV